MQVYYSRVTTEDQNAERQLQELVGKHCKSKGYVFLLVDSLFPIKIPSAFLTSAASGCMPLQ